jgi:hypothetical protein
MNRRKVEDWLADAFKRVGHDIKIDATVWETDVRLYISYRAHHKTAAGWDLEEGSMMVERDIAKARGWL